MGINNGTHGFTITQTDGPEWSMTDYAYSIAMALQAVISAEHKSVFTVITQIPVDLDRLAQLVTNELADLLTDYFNNEADTVHVDPTTDGLSVRVEIH